MRDDWWREGRGKVYKPEGEGEGTLACIVARLCCSVLFHFSLPLQAVTPPMPLYPPGVTPVVPGVPLSNATPATQLAQQVANEVSTKLQEAGQCSLRLQDRPCCVRGLAVL